MRPVTIERAAEGEGASENLHGQSIRERGGSCAPRRSSRKPMSKQPAFWDASALVPLCVHEMASHQAQSHVRQCLPVVWWAVKSRHAERFYLNPSYDLEMGHTNNQRLGLVFLEHAYCWLKPRDVLILGVPQSWPPHPGHPQMFQGGERPDCHALKYHSVSRYLAAVAMI